MTSRRRPVTFAVVRRVALSFPGVEEGFSYGTAGFRVRGRFLARLKEDGESLVVKCGFDERDLRLQANPAAFYVTDHYRGYPTVLIRLPVVTLEELRAVFEQAWRRNASTKLLSEYKKPRR